MRFLLIFVCVFAFGADLTKEFAYYNEVFENQTIKINQKAQKNSDDENNVEFDKQKELCLSKDLLKDDDRIRACASALGIYYCNAKKYKDFLWIWGDELDKKLEKYNSDEKMRILTNTATILTQELFISDIFMSVFTNFESKCKNDKKFCGVSLFFGVENKEFILNYTLNDDKKGFLQNAIDIQTTNHMKSACLRGFDKKMCEGF